MSSIIAPTIQLPEGYVANERIGSGGYGEVWRATAPGGIEKAVKVVFGHCEDELAERELKSLERIRSVRHPFVISLERFEVVAGRLVIVTELADTSLDACFRKYQAAGKAGIPRVELINYLKDAAEALDCLVEQHSLQHLDIKPENLLVVGEHVKIGDFGLVKELATRTLNSMMGGMTPLYSAPEVFDDSPSPRSDQYSLAIVYQQMLTGQVPFPGRTPAQLAKQHTQAEPILHALSERDRPIVSKALSKLPERRFTSCREFVAALASDGLRPNVSAFVTNNNESQRRKIIKDDETKSSAALGTQPLIESIKPGTNVSSKAKSVTDDTSPTDDHLYPSAEEGIVNVSLPEVDYEYGVTLPTLIVGLGGLGINMLNAIRIRMATAKETDSSSPHVAWLAIDTDYDALKDITNDKQADPFQREEILHISLKRPKEYVKESGQLLGWVSRRWLYNIPRSLETRGYRPLGRIAAVDHAESILGSLYSKLCQLVQKNPTTQKLRVVLLASTSGGTGSGIVIDIGQAVRSLAGDLNVPMQIDTILTMSEQAASAVESLSIANTYSLLIELAHAQRRGNLGSSSLQGPSARYESEFSPFDTVSWIIISPRNQGNDRGRAFQSIAEQLTLETTVPEAAAAFVACSKAGYQNDFRMQSFACIPVDNLESSLAQLDHFQSSIIGCRFQRISLLICRPESSFVEPFQNHLPLLAICNAPVPKEVLVYAARGIDPIHIGARLAKYYPDIAEAANRLHTRNDIDWQDLCICGQSNANMAPTPVKSESRVEDQLTLKRIANV